MVLLTLPLVVRRRQNRTVNRKLARVSLVLQVLLLAPHVLLVLVLPLLLRVVPIPLPRLPRLPRQAARVKAPVVLLLPHLSVPLIPVRLARLLALNPKVVSAVVRKHNMFVIVLVRDPLLTLLFLLSAILPLLLMVLHADK